MSLDFYCFDGKMRIIFDYREQTRVFIVNETDKLADLEQKILEPFGIERSNPTFVLGGAKMWKSATFGFHKNELTKNKFHIRIFLWHEIEMEAHDELMLAYRAVGNSRQEANLQKECEAIARRAIARLDWKLERKKVEKKLKI